MKRDTWNRQLHVLLIPATLAVTACAIYFPRKPILPEHFEGPLGASADSIVASTTPSYCSRVYHVDTGTSPQGCMRKAGDMSGWVNWKGATLVTKVGRSWIQPDGATALRVGRSMESELAGRLGPPVECHYAYQWTAREVRWIAVESTGISTAVIVWGDVKPMHPTATPRVILIRTLGTERCGDHYDAPRK